MTTPSTSNIHVASARLADQLVKLGVPLAAQGVVINGTRCFVFENKPEHTRALKQVLGNGYAG